MNKIIDLRSDTVTKPSAQMRKAMYDAEVGDDVYGEDPSVNALQDFAAELLGKEAALFVPSGVMGNQLCLNSLTESGDEVICEYQSHIFNYESGSPAALSGLSLHPLLGVKGVLSAEQIEEAIRPSSAYYMPRTKVIAIENTHNRASGAVQPFENLKQIKKIADSHRLYYHLDGARIWNASAATGIAAQKYASLFDTISCCLSKGLGAPVGSIIASASELISEAFRKRKAWGGGMRQAGIIAAAGLFALKNNRERLIEDHVRAKKIASALAEISSVKIDVEDVQTNIILFEPLKLSANEVIQKGKLEGLLLSVGTKKLVRAVTHLDIDDYDIERAIKIIKNILA